MGKFLGRWAPLAGGALLAASVILPFFHQSELAALVAGLAGLTGVGAQSPVSAGDLGSAAAQVAAAVAVVVGIVRKFIAVAKAPAPPQA